MLTALLCASPAVGQESGLAIVGGLTYAVGGPGPALVSELDDAGYGDLNLEACSGGVVCDDAIQNPLHSDRGLSVGTAVGLEYRFDAPFSVEALIARGQRGYAEGYDDGVRERVVLDYSSFTMSTTVNVHYGALRLGVGPALSRAVWQATRNADRGVSESTLAPGGLAILSVDLPTRLLTVSLRAGGRSFAAVDLSDFVGLPLQPAYTTFFAGAHVKIPID